jgi:hypothetical protein
MEELVRPDDMLMVEERIEDRLLLDIEELAVRDERLPDIISEPDDPAETPAPPDEELEVEAPPLREVEEYHIGPESAHEIAASAREDSRSYFEVAIAALLADICEASATLRRVASAEARAEATAVDGDSAVCAF